MKKLFCIISLILAASVLWSITFDEKDGAVSVTADRYSASVSADFLTSLNIDGAELLSAVWLQNRWSPVTVVRNENTVICIKKGFGKAEYSFYDDRIDIAVVNNTQNALKYSTVLSSAFDGVITDMQSVYPLLNASVDKAVFTRGSLGLNIAGEMVLEGPEDGGQLIWTSINPGETKHMVLTPSRITDAQQKEAKRLMMPAYLADAPVRLYSPVDYQVFQRRSLAKGIVIISGKAHGDRIAYKISGQTYTGKKYTAESKADIVEGGFNFTCEVPAGGWYSFECEAFDGGVSTGKAAVERFGVGEVIISSGQSNSTNRAPDRTKSRTGMAAATDGVEWRLCDDPMPGQHDSFEGHQGGSLYPFLGDFLYEALRVPVAFASTGHGGRNAADWLPGSELYNWLLNRIREFGPGGFRCVIWHQGENEQFTKTTAEEYYNIMSLIIGASCCDAGWYFPWFTAKATYMSPEYPAYEPVRIAQQRLWNKHISLTGPDTDTLIDKYRSYAHFTPEGLDVHARLWSYLLADYIKKQY